MKAQMMLHILNGPQYLVAEPPEEGVTMKAQTMLHILNGPQYLVAEPPEEVRDRWVQAAQAGIDDKAQVVELTCVTGTFDPYPLIVSPSTISHFEAATELVVAYNQRRHRKQWDAFKREMDEQGTGFGGGE